jgi:hypothetical protein
MSIICVVDFRFVFDSSGGTIVIVVVVVVVGGGGGKSTTTSKIDIESIGIHETETFSLRHQLIIHALLS